MTVTWTSGYDISEAVAFVEWGPKGRKQIQSAAGTLTFNRNSMCGKDYYIVKFIQFNGTVLRYEA
jgi:hypothetical protein